VTLLTTKRVRMPETDTTGWEAWHAATRLIDVEHSARLQAFFFKFGDGRIFGLSRDLVEGLDATPVTRISVIYDDSVAAIEQFSGNRVEIPWDMVLYHADLSTKTGIKIPNLSRLEHGKHTPSLDTLEEVAVALGLPVAAPVAR
jgi:hypothetical protein